MLPLLFALGLLLIGTVLLVVGADWFLDGAGDLARALGVSALVLGVLLAGLEPEEMLTAAIASARGAPALAVGNVIGTNVTIVTVALGLSTLIFPMTISVRVRRQAFIATLVSIIPIVFLFLGAVTQLEGVFLLVVGLLLTLALTMEFLFVGLYFGLNPCGNRSLVPARPGRKYAAGRPRAHGSGCRRSSPLHCTGCAPGWGALFWRRGAYVSGDRRVARRGA